MPFIIRECCVGNNKANEDFGEAWMLIITLVTLCLKMGITLCYFHCDSAQRRISLESHAKYLAYDIYFSITEGQLTQSSNNR